MTALVLSVIGAAAGSWTLAGAATAGAFVLPARRELLDRLSTILLIAGAALLGILLAALWVHLDRAPMRTLGETRLWYAFLLPVIGLFVEWRLKTRALRLPMIFFGVLFLSINLLRPDYLDKTLMPALQSPWFVPHVVVYMVSYAALGLSCGVAVWVLAGCWWKGTRPTDADAFLPILLMRLGLPFLTFGLLFGALWAKEAWGHYWTWDPKETWAFLTWAVYLSALHLIHDKEFTPARILWILALGFLVVLGCWFLVNYLPAAQVSVHTYAT